MNPSGFYVDPNLSLLFYVPESLPAGHSLQRYKKREEFGQNIQKSEHKMQK